MTHEDREALVKQVFQRITIDGKDFVDIGPKPEYAPLFANIATGQKVWYRETDSALTTGTDSMPYNPTMPEDKGNIDLAPDDATAYRNRGLSYSDLGQYRRAIEDYDKAIELDPNDATAYYNRGLTYRRLGQYRRAIEDFDKAIELDPNFADVYHNRGLS